MSLIQYLNLNMAHWHLLLNHIPILGAMFITLLFIVALIFRNTFLQKVSLWFLAGVALITAVTYVTGERSVSIVQSLPNVSTAMIQAHKQAAQLGLILMFITGVIALGGALLYSRRPKLPRFLLTIVLVILLLNSALFTYIGFLGGQITHPEIRTPISAPVGKQP